MRVLERYNTTKHVNSYNDLVARIADDYLEYEDAMIVVYCESILGGKMVLEVHPTCVTGTLSNVLVLLGAINSPAYVQIEQLD